MNYIRKIKKNSKALSPVVASIILIAVTVAVSVVVAAWMGGMTIGLMGNAEQGSITNAVCTSTNQVTVTVRNTGAASLTLSSATIDGNSTTVTATGSTTSLTISKGSSGTYIVPTSAGTFVDGAGYSIKLITAKGNTIVGTVTYTAP
jgi:flagellin-like protein